MILADASLRSYPSYFRLNIILLEDLQVKCLYTAWIIYADIFF